MPQQGKQHYPRGRFAGKTVFLAAGGTGGHVFPAEALSRVLAERGMEPHLLTDSRARSFIALGAGGFAENAVHVLDGATFAGKNPLRYSKSLLKLAKGFWQALRLIFRYKPCLIVGFGGYPTVAPLFAARLMGVPIIIHEQNAVMGRANRLLARHAKAIASGFPLASPKPKWAEKAYFIGNPLRAAVVAAAETPYHPARDDEPFTLLVFGGSQGASFFSEIMPRALALMPARQLKRLHLIQQARRGEEAGLRAAYAKLGIKAETAPFFTDLPGLMAKAQFVAARAGASTVAELAAIGRPSLLVPYPKALDGDQRHNARALAAYGGAEIAEQAGLTAAKLAAVLTKAMELPQVLSQKAAAAAAAGRKDAAQKLADLAQAQLPDAEKAKQ